MSLLSDIFNPPVNRIPAPSISGYQPGNMGGADAQAFGGIGNLSNFNLYPGLVPQAQDITSGLINNAGIPSYLQGAQTAQGMGQGAAANAFGLGGGLIGAGGNLFNQAQPLFNYSQNLLTAGFDPQTALYNRTLQQVQDQSRAGQAARGIAMTPYGAGLEDQNIRNFNMDWNNQQLQRMIQAGQGAGGMIGQGANLYGQGGNLIGAGAGLQAGAAPQYLQSSAFPYQVNQGIGQGQFGALSNLGQFGQAGSQIPQQQIGDLLNYLGWGTQAQNALNSANLGASSLALKQNQQGYDQMSGALGGIGKLAGGVLGFGLGGPAGATVGSSLMGGLSNLGSRAFGGGASVNPYYAGTWQPAPYG